MTPRPARTKPRDTRATDELLRAHGLRRTDPRVTVLEFLRRRPKPISHGELTDALAPIGLDRVTVYRNLMDLAEAGILVRSDLGDHVWRFELRSGHGEDARHPHFVCTDCGGITCLPEASVSLVPGRRSPRALRTRDVTIQLKGLCDACA